ncbi:MAG: DUF115 domain-containing protein, partial [Gammaproteobacteria bacterium]|nr:DUF115 domain-containing protein [Gammaproteobacteria bacterium]
MSNNLPLPFAEVLEKNLVALGEKNPALEKELRQDWETSSIELIRCWDGKTLNLMFKLPLSDAKAFTAYDMHDPREPLAKAIANEGKRYENGVTIILGSGLGYVLREVLKQAEEGHHILVIEPDGFLLKTTLSLKDYSNKLREGSLSLCDGEAPSIVAAVGALENKISIEQPYIDSEPYTGFLKEVYGPVGEQTVKTLNQVRSNVSTVAQKGDEIIRNEYQSLPYIVRQKGIGELANAFTGKPFVIVSTGPSLGKNIHLLRDIQDKVIIFAVVQALKALLAYGVKPDAVCAIDYGELAKPHFEGILETHDIPFLALCRSRADMIRDYQGPILVSGTSYGDIDYYINNLWRIKGIINPGNSVAHFAFCAAHVLGGDPIILMGQDLALSSTSHFDQVDHNAAISLSAKGIQTVLSDKRSKYDGYQPAEEIPISIPGWYGAPVVTRAVLLGFLALFEQLVPLHNGTVINATEGGAYIKGAKHISLKAAARKYCKEPVDKALFANTTSAVNVDDLTQQVVERMTQEKELIDKMIELCQSALKANHQAGSLLDHAEKKGPTQDLADQITAALQTNFKLTSEAEQISKQHLPAMQMAMLGLDSKARSHIHKGSLNNADVLGSYKNPVKRNRMYLTEAIKQAKMLGKIYAQDLRIMNRFLKAKQALSDKPNSGKTLVDLSAALLGMGHFIEAKALLDNAREKLPKNLLILEALGKLCVKMELWEDYASVKLELGRLGSKSRK